MFTRYIRIKIFLLVSLGFVPQDGAGQSGYIAFLGDSITTGAVSHEALSFSKSKLWNVFRGRTSVKPSLVRYKTEVGDDIPSFDTPIRLNPTTSEFFGPTSWVGLHLLNTWSQVYIDTEEYSWAYILSRRLGYPADKMLFAAQDGAKMAAGVRQAQRVLNYTGDVVPDKIFIFFTGNDLCGPGIDFMTPIEDFSQQLDNTVRLFLANGTIIGDQGVDIYVVGGLGVIQLIQSDAVLGKYVSAREKVMTCKELLADSTSKEMNSKEKEYITKNPDSSLFFTMFPSSPAPWCPTLFSKNIGATDDQPQRLANRIRSYRKAASDTVANLSKTIKDSHQSNVRLHFLNSGRLLTFAADDIAEDCFHLSLQGQAKVANSLQKEMQNESKH